MLQGQAEPRYRGAQGMEEKQQSPYDVAGQVSAGGADPRDWGRWGIGKALQTEPSHLTVLSLSPFNSNTCILFFNGNGHFISNLGNRWLLDSAKGKNNHQPKAQNGAPTGSYGLTASTSHCVSDYSPYPVNCGALLKQTHSLENKD